MRKRLAKILAALAPLLLCGCLEVSDKLAINADGSGTVRIETRADFPIEMIQMMGMGMRMSEEEPVSYPPVNKRDAAKFFPGTAFKVNVTEKRQAQSSHSVVEVSFADVNALLASPYGEAHALSLVVDGGKLQLKAATGLEAAARAASSEGKQFFNDMLQGMPGVKKSATNAAKYAFEITLPGAVTESNGAHTGNSVKWAFEGREADKALLEKITQTLTASASAAEIKFKPVAPMRLAAANFADVKAGPMDSSGPKVDVEKVKAAVKFTPYSLRVTRAVDLSGDAGFGMENAAVLSGAITVPKEFAPSEWGEAKLEEAKDAKGKDLLTKEDDENFDRFASRTMNFHDQEFEDEEEAQKPAVTKRSVTFRFNPPEWASGEIATIKGKVTMNYFGGSQIIKVANALPKSAIMNPENGSFSFNEDSEIVLSDPKLSEMGLKLKLEHAMKQSSFLSISMKAEGKKAVSKAQVYDADGKPWPTQFTKNDYGDQTSYSLMVQGDPKPPLSFAIVVPDVAASVEVPISLENVPVRGKK